MSKLNHLNRSDRAKYNAKLGDIIGEVSKSSGIIATKSGESFVINDSADAPISNLKIYGRTDQFHAKGENHFDVFSATLTSANDTCVVEAPETGCLKTIIRKKGSPQFGSASIEFPTYNELYVKFQVRCSNADLTKPEVRIGLTKSGTSTNAIKKIFTEISPEWANFEYKITLTNTEIETYDRLTLILYVKNNSVALENVGEYVEMKDIILSTSNIEYEPYTGLAPSPSPGYPQKMNIVQSGVALLSFDNGNDNEELIKIKTPFSMRGIPVSSDGNVTDENGQQWICDEIDTKSKELIVRIGEEICSDGSEWLLNNIASSTYYNTKISVKKDTYALSEDYRNVKYSTDNLSNNDNVISVMNYISIRDTRFSSLAEWRAHIKDHPIKVQYILPEAIRIPLSNQQIACLKNISTFRPVTIISNDAGAIVEVSYYADKKTYIDQKFDELKALALEN